MDIVSRCLSVDENEYSETCVEAASEIVRLQDENKKLRSALCNMLEDGDETDRKQAIDLIGGISE